MKDRALSAHIWSAIEAQAKTAAASIKNIDKGYIEDGDIEKVNEFELKRLRILVRQLEEESPN